MSIAQFLRILWARRLIIIAATVSCIAGAMAIALILPPRWQAHSRVMLDWIKPDPVTGEVNQAKGTHTFAATQVELIKDYNVAGQVVDRLGWLSDPTLIAAYENRSKGDTRDFRRWAAQLIIDRTDAELIEGSNIVEITYTATTADSAKAIADSLTKAYVDSSVAFRRQQAAQNAQWFDAQAKKDKDLLDTAETAKTSYERENGILMQDDKTDVDTARLRALSSAGPAPSTIFSAPGSSPASAELAQLDAQIAQAAKTLGPNHPELQAMRARRNALAGIAAQERAANRAPSGGGQTSGAIEREVAAQKARVMSQRDKLGRLIQLQGEVDLRRDQYNKSAARAAQLHQEAAVMDNGLTILSAATTPQKPKFPNMPLIGFGSVGLGLGTGVLLALLLELFHRRIRSPEDLQLAGEIPLLAVVSLGGTAKKQGFRSRPSPHKVGSGQHARTARA